MVDTVPFNRASLEGNEQAYMAQAVANGHISGDGPFTKRCHTLLETELDVNRVLLTTSCTHALEMTALLLGLRRGDEVIIPSFTFVSTANAYVLHGARPIFVDIRSDTLNLNEALVEDRITERTKAIVVVHYAGVGCEMQTITDIARRRGLVVIEDNAHGLFGKYRDRYLGTFGQLATLSFHETKNVTCGEGGALLINDPKYTEHAEIIREKGTNRAKFFRGQVDKYTWQAPGSSYLPSEILAAFLYGQLEARTRIQEKRKRIWEYYYAKLADWARANGVRLPIVPPDREQSYHMFYLLLPSLKQRQRLIDQLRARGILSVFHYQPLHLSPMGRLFGGRPGDCRVTEDVSDRLLRLPFYNDLSESAQEQVVDAITVRARTISSAVSTRRV